MAKKEETKTEIPAEELIPEEEAPAAPAAPEQAPEAAPEAPAEPAVDWEAKYNAEHDAHLRLAAEYDNPTR